jgi:hypothetical protein
MRSALRLQRDSTQDSAMSDFIHHTRSAFALLASQLAFALRSASTRSLSVSMPTVSHAATRHLQFVEPAKIFERIVAAVAFATTWVLLAGLFILFATAFYTIGQLFYHRTRLVLFVVVLVAFSIVFLFGGGAADNADIWLGSQ